MIAVGDMTLAVSYIHPVNTMMRAVSRSRLGVGRAVENILAVATLTNGPALVPSLPFALP